MRRLLAAALAGVALAVGAHAQVDGEASGDRPAIDALSIDAQIAALASEEHGTAAQLALLRRGAETAAPLGRAIAEGWRTDPRGPRARAAAARVLQELGPVAAEACEPLYASLFDEHAPDDVPRLAAETLRIAAPCAGEVADPLRRLLDHNGGNLRQCGVSRVAIDALTRTHAALTVDGAGATLDELLLALREYHPYAIATACQALGFRRDEFAHDARAIDGLRALIRREFEPHVRWMWYVGDRPMWWRTTAANVRWLRTTASLALAELAPDDPASYLGHCQRLFALDPRVRLEAIDRLARLRHADAGRWLLNVAADATAPTTVRVAALGAMERIGPALAVYNRRLHHLAEHSDTQPPVAAAATRCLRLLAPNYSADSGAPSLEVVGSGFLSGDGLRPSRERRLLLAWLDREHGANRHALHVDPGHIESFHALPPEDGGPRNENVRWVPYRTPPDPWRPGRWSTLLSETIPGAVLAAPAGAVGRHGERLEDLPWVVELIPVDRRGTRFTTEDCDRIQQGSRSGEVLFSLRLTDDRKGDLDDLARRLLLHGGALVFVVDGLGVAQQPIDGRAPRIGPWLLLQVVEPALDRLPALERLRH